MFIKLHHFDGTGAAVPQLINISDVRTVHYTDRVDNPIGEAPAYIRLTWIGGGAPNEFILGKVQDGKVVQHLEPKDFETAVSRALRQPGVYGLHAAEAGDPSTAQEG